MTRILSRTQPELITCESPILHTGEDEKGRYFVVEQTVFYPQGGGQMSDHGSVTQHGQSHLVRQTLNHGGEVRHYLADPQVSLDIGQLATLTIDAEFRRRASLAHTAGHLIAHVVETLMPSLVPAKGHHFLPGAYVEFTGNSTLAADQLLEQVRSKVAEAIEQDLPVTIESMSFDEIARLRPELAGSIPQNEEMRIVRLGDYVPVACGGTHAATTQALRGLELRKIKAKERIKISYEFA
ncbi:MAG: alanine--tRNA ligase-related protein [Ewingella sp.]|uniref:alanine--tRNA ligase-related protein n=1 Tax=Ewingella TaxID=41201 RepID=UPI003365982C